MEKDFENINLNNLNSKELATLLLNELQGNELVALLLKELHQENLDTLLKAFNEEEQTTVLNKLKMKDRAALKKRLEYIEGVKKGMIAIATGKISEIKIK